jgi:hypothetical protein
LGPAAGGAGVGAEVSVSDESYTFCESEELVKSPDLSSDFGLGGVSDTGGD